MEPWTGRPVRLCEVSKTQPWVDIESVAWGKPSGHLEGGAGTGEGRPQSCPTAVHQGCNTSSQHSRKRAFVDYGLDPEIQQVIVPDDLSLSLGCLQFSSEPDPDFTRGRPVAVARGDVAVPRFLWQPDPATPSPDIWQGVDDLLSDSRNLRLLDVAESGLSSSPPRQLKAPSLPQPLRGPPPPSQPQHQQPLLLQHHNQHQQQQQQQQHSQQQQQPQQQQQQHYQQLSSQALPSHQIRLTAHSHSMTLQQQQQQHHHHHHQQQQEQPNYYQTQQHIMATVGASPSPNSGLRNSGTGVDTSSWAATPLQHRQQSPILSTLSSSDIPRPISSSGRSSSGPVGRFLDVSRFTASCHVHSPANSQQGLHQFTATPNSGGAAVGFDMGCSGGGDGGGGGGLKVLSYSAERMREVNESWLSGASAAAVAEAPYGASVPGWGVPRDLAEHMDMSPLISSQPLHRQLSLRSDSLLTQYPLLSAQRKAIRTAPPQPQQDPGSWVPQQPAMPETSNAGAGVGAFGAGSRYSVHGGEVAVAVGKLLSDLAEEPTSHSNMTTINVGVRVSGGAIPLEELTLNGTPATATATVAVMDDMLYGSVGLGDGRGEGSGVAVAPSKFLRRASPPSTKNPSAYPLFGSKTVSGGMSRNFSVGSGSVLRANQDAFGLPCQLAHQQQQQQQQQQHQERPFELPQVPVPSLQLQMSGQSKCCHPFQQQFVSYPLQQGWQATQQHVQQHHHHHHQSAQQQHQQNQQHEQQIVDHHHRQQQQLSPSQQKQGEEDRPQHQSRLPNQRQNPQIPIHQHQMLSNKQQQQQHPQQQLPNQQEHMLMLSAAGHGSGSLDPTYGIMQGDLHLHGGPGFERPLAPSMSAVAAAQVQAKAVQRGLPPPQPPPEAGSGNPPPSSGPRGTVAVQELRRSVLSIGSFTGVIHQERSPMAPSNSAGSCEDTGGSGVREVTNVGVVPAPASNSIGCAGAAGWSQSKAIVSHGKAPIKDEPQCSATSGEKEDAESSEMGRSMASTMPDTVSALQATNSSAGTSSASITAIAGAAAAPQPVSKAIQRAAAAALAREAAGTTKLGRPRQRTRTSLTLADVIRVKLIAPGPHQFLVGNQDTVDVHIFPDGRIECVHGEFRSISSLALAVLRQRNPNRMACDGWQEVKLNGVRLDELRQEAVRLLARGAAATYDASISNTADTASAVPTSANEAAEVARWNSAF